MTPDPSLATIEGAPDRRRVTLYRTFRVPIEE